MLNFFRKIRKKLAADNKFGRYTRYAIGEVVLIMLGIFMALQLQNWNEKRKQDIQFKTTLERLYNTITDDSWSFDQAMRENENVINVMDSLLSFKKDENINNLPWLMWSTVFFKKSTYGPSSPSIIDNMTYNTNDLEQDKLANRLFDFNKLILEKTTDFYKHIDNIESILLANNVPLPGFDHNNINRGFISDSTHYSLKELLNAKELLSDDNFIANLKTRRTIRAFEILDYKTLKGESEGLLNAIRKYYPEVKLIFENVGIIGTSLNGFDDVGARSTPMTLTDEENSIWELETHLKAGRIKFRCRDSWAINWGGDTSPKGIAKRDGIDIEIAEAGHYRVILNLSEFTYEFIKLDN